MTLLLQRDDFFNEAPELSRFFAILSEKWEATDGPHAEDDLDEAEDGDEANSQVAEDGYEAIPDPPPAALVEEPPRPSLARANTKVSFEPDRANLDLVRARKQALLCLGEWEPLVYH